MLLPRKTAFLLLLFVGLSLYAQQDCFINSYIRGNFYSRGRISVRSLKANDDLIFLNAHPNENGSLSFENPRIFENRKRVTSWEELIEPVHADAKGIETKPRLSAVSDEWKAVVADKVVRVVLAKNIKKTLKKNKLGGIDLDSERAEIEKEYEDYSLATLEVREVLGGRYMFSVSLHPVCYRINKEAIAAADFTSYQCYSSSPVHFLMEKHCLDIQMALTHGVPKEKLVTGVPFYGVTKDGSERTEAYFSSAQGRLITGPTQDEVIRKGDVYAFDRQNSTRAEMRYATDQQLKGMMSWSLATGMPLNDSRSLFETVVKGLGG